MTDKGTSEHWAFDPKNYEGHTPGPWLATFSLVRKVQGWSTWTNGVGGRVARVFGRKATEAEANARLIADAPRILAEAVRLRAENERLREELEEERSRWTHTPRFGSRRLVRDWGEE